VIIALPCAAQSSASTKQSGEGTATNPASPCAKDYYYLIFNDVNVKYPNLRSFYSAITEFGTYIEYSDALAAKLHETATLIIKNHVVKVATKYFVK
jgi:negative regulator of genetic competence, sporulation and motility